MNSTFHIAFKWLLGIWMVIPLVGSAQQRDSSLHLYILMGQSNMAGRGPLTEAYKSMGHERVRMFDKHQQWLPAAHPLHFDKPKVAGVGPGLSFGIAMAEAYPDATIGLVPCAVGGTAITKWAPGVYDKPSDTYPYNDAVIRIMEAMKYGVVKGVIWHQGEGDSNPEAASLYMDRLTEFIQRIRTVVGNPSLPFVVGELGRYRKNYEAVNKQLPKLPDAVPNTRVVSSEGLWHHGDGTHFDSPSASEYGRRYAVGMLQLQGKQPMVAIDAVGSGVTRLTEKEREEGWELLFDGQDPTIRWRSVQGDRFPSTDWVVKDGVLMLLPGPTGGDIVTREQFSDFELVLDFKLADSANTGIKYFVAPLENAKGKVELNGPEYQLIDDFKHASVKNGKSPETSTASLYLLYRPKRKMLKQGEWNEARIVAKGMYVEHWLNGRKVLTYERGSPEFRKRVADTKFNGYRTPYGEADAGYILLQDHHDAAYFRNIKIRRLSP